MKQLIALAAGLTLMACTPAETPADPAATTPASDSAAATPQATPPADPAAQPPVTPPAGDDTCNKAQYASLVGQPITTAGVPPAGPNVRHIRPDTQVTMDFRPDRLNIHINADGVITELRCT